MKKIYRAIGICLFILAAVGIGLVVRFFTYDPEIENTPVARPTVVDSAGRQYLAVVDGNGVTYAVVTDAEGNRYAAEYNGLQVGNTVGQINDQVKLEDIPSYKGEGSFDVTVGGNFQGDVSVQVQNPTNPDGTPVQSPEDGLKAYRIDKYSEIFKSGNYIMEFTTDGTGTDEEIIIATKDGNVYLETATMMEESGEVLPMKVIFRSNGDTYILFDIAGVKKYSKLPEDMSKEMNMSEMSNVMSDFVEPTQAEITVSKVSINGQELILESYVNPEDGSTVNYYFSNDDILVRRDIVPVRGNVESTYFSRVSNDAPDSMFEIPDEYSYFNISWLSALM